MMEDDIKFDDMALKRSLREQADTTLFTDESLFLPASLNISTDEWTEIVYLDVDLAVQIGCMLLKRQKNLNMIITAADICAEEQALKVQFYERQIKSLKESFDHQTSLYEKFENELAELTRSYNNIQAECSLYKKKNKKLWKSIESLEKTCDDYLEEINCLKSKQRYHDDAYLQASISSTQSSTELEQNSSIDEMIEQSTPEYSHIISLRASSEEFSRKLDVERNQRIELEKKIEKLCSENRDLHAQIQWLEYKMVREEPCSTSRPLTNISKSKSLFDVSMLDGSLPDDMENKQQHMCSQQGTLTVPFIINTTEFENELLSKKELFTSSPVKETSSCSQCTSGVQSNINLKENHSPSIRKNSSLSNYQEIFDEIFEKLKKSRDN